MPQAHDIRQRMVNGREPAMIEVAEIAVDAGHRRFLPGAEFGDSYVMPTIRMENAVSAAHRLLAAMPPWSRPLMILRNIAVAPFGLVRDTAKIAGGKQRIGIFPVLSTSAGRAILGFNDKHLDFRIIIDVKPAEALGQNIVMTTLVKTHNRFGRIYLSVIKPFHRRIIRAMMRRAG
jgi:Protein of unknown function (DUF2867)